MKVALAVIVLALFAGTADAAQKQCVGAAARDPEKMCVDDSKRVTPTPDEALITPNVACARGDLADSCTYGSHVPLATVALVGDSHAGHWRAGMDALAKSRRWRVVEFARPHCPFSYSEPAPTEAGASDCVAYNQRVVAWLAEHPDVASVFVSNNARLPMAEKGMGYKVQGHVAALRALPPSVTRVFVLRDTPTARVSTPDCIRRAVRRKLTPGTQCAIPRGRALVTDATAVAAQQLGRTVIDLTPFFCSTKQCFPVVGGVLVHKDQDHLTQNFSRTLGPYIGRAVDKAP
ncbi:SGNH hydrolase domain-containing protein [Solirubrobacter taibaiensis]|nr:SGNH hydrolase domain-containing protein [Solirubrobacter taibaiensis]